MPADASGLRDLLTRWSLAVAEGWSDELTTVLKDAAPVNQNPQPSSRPPGTLRDAITHTPVAPNGEGAGFQVQAPGIEAVTTAKGARPHVIRPVRGKVLVFQVDGSTVFARSVDHPGNTGTDWFNQALRNSGAEALQRAARSPNVPLA